MKLPYPKHLDKTPVLISLTSGQDEEGTPIEVASYSGLCRFMESSKTIHLSDGKTRQLSAIIVLGTDIAPNVPTLEGYVVVSAIDYKINTGKRPRNPDGTVQHTELELI
jgi:hypothetical protein